MSDINDCRKSVERLTRDRGEVMSAGNDEIAEIRARHLRDDRWCYSPSPQMHDDRAWLLAEVDRLRADLATQHGCCDGAAAQDSHVRRERDEMQNAKADAWDDGYEAHRQMIEGVARKPSNPYRGRTKK